MTEVTVKSDNANYQNQPYVSITHVASGATADITLHGGQLVSFRTGGAKNPTEVLYKSPTTKVGLKKTAIRGGVPVCLPQFSDFGPLTVSHGFARILTWEHVPDNSAAILRLTAKSVRKQFQDLEITNMTLPAATDFCYTIKVTLKDANTLDMTLTVENGEKNPEPLSFTGCLHTYFSVSSLSKLRIDGVYSTAPFLDGTNKRVKCEPDNLHEFKDEVDRIYLGAAKTRNPLVQPAVTLGDAGRNSQVQIHFHNMDDLVLWNPSTKRSFKDLPAGDYDKFVCVEGCMIQPAQVLAPGQKWEGGQTIRYIDTSSQEISRL